MCVSVGVGVYCLVVEEFFFVCLTRSTIVVALLTLGFGLQRSILLQATRLVNSYVLEVLRGRTNVASWCEPS